MTTETLASETRAEPLALLLDIRAVARLLDCSPRHIARLVRAGQFPRPIKLGRLIRWRRADLDEFLADDKRSERT